MSSDGVSSVDLYWIPLGAGARVVRLSGRCFEATVAATGRRPRCDLYHSALEIRTPEGSFTIEMTPVPKVDGNERGVVADGAVGTRWAGRLRVFHYEVRCWRDGQIPDATYAVGGPLRLSVDPNLAQRIVEGVHEVPAPTWGRDELGAGEMWNSNSVISWVLAHAGFDITGLHPPRGGRAPGWDAGLLVATRQTKDSDGVNSSPLRSDREATSVPPGKASLTRSKYPSAILEGQRHNLITDSPSTVEPCARRCAGSSGWSWWPMNPSISSARRRDLVGRM